MPNTEHIQQQLALLREEFANSLYKRVDQVISNLNTLQANVNTDVNLQEIFRQIHSMSGSAGTFGFTRLSEHSRQLELILKELINNSTVPDAKTIDYLNNGLQNLHNLIARGPDIDISDRSQSNSQTDPALTRGETKRLIFIVEDDAALGATLCHQLNHHGFKTQLFSSAADAASALKQKKPDVMLLDIALPEGLLGGAELVTDLPTLLDEPVPCVFISSCGDWKTRLAAVRAGGAAYLQKPVDISILADQLDRITLHRQREPYRILVVDDALELGQHYALILRQAGMHAEALTEPSMILQNIERFKPELILLDIYFPGITGIEIAQVVRQHQNHNSIPIVFLSTETNRDIQLKTLRQGDGFLEKPIADTQLVNIVKTRIDRAREFGQLMYHDGLTGLLNQVTLKRRTAELQSSAQLNRTIVENAVDAVITIDIKGIVSRFNPAAVKMFGYEEAEVVGQNIKMLMPDPFHSEHDGYLAHHKQTGEKRIIGIGREVAGQHKDGTVFPINLAVGEAADNGSTIYVGTNTDLTELKAKENELKASKKLSEAIINNAVDAVITIDDKGSISLFSPAAVKLFGYNSDEVIGKNVKMLMPEPYRSEHDGYLSHHKQTGEKRIIGIGREVMGQRKDSSIFPMNLSVGKATVDGKTLYVGTVTDLTELKTREQELRDFTNRLELATKAGGIGVWVYDIDKGILQWDDRMFELYGIKRDQFSGPYEAWKNAFHADDLEQAEANFKKIMADGKQFETEYRIIWPDDQVHYIQAFGEVMVDEKERGNRMIGVNQDITQRKLAEQAMKQAKKAAEEANRQKSAFLNIMSHELRTPLTVILGYLPILKNQQKMPPPETIKQIAEDMDISGQHLMEMINDLLDISKIEADQMTLSIEETQVLPLLQEMQRKFKYQASKKAIQLQSETQDFCFKVDKRRLRQILINLIGNALKFTDQGQITLSARKGDSSVTFSVTDTGIGIAEHELPFVFDTFRQVDNTSTRNTGGSGLGLAITKRLVELHGGTIWAKSKPGEGSTFTFTIKQ